MFELENVGIMNELENFWVYTSGNWHISAKRSQMEVKGGDGRNFDCSDTMLQIKDIGLLEKD